MRRQRSRLESFVAAPTATEAYPCTYCARCGHRPTCDSEWRENDHLSYVAGIRRAHVDALLASGVPTLAELATLDPDTAVPGIQSETLAGLVEQAALQASTRARDDSGSRSLQPERPQGGMACTGTIGRAAPID